MDASGNVISGLTDVDFAVDVGANATAGTVSETTTDGTYTFTVTNTTIETITVVITADGVTLDDQPTIDFQAGAASEMTITQQPTSATAGTAIAPAPAVEVTDGTNPVSGVNVTAILSSNDFTATSTVVATTDASGIAEFGNLVIETAGTGYTITFDADAANVDSDPFDVTAAAGDPASTTATVPDGTAGSSTVMTINVTDEFGNVVSGVATALSVVVSGDNTANPTVSETGTAGEYTASYTPDNSGTDNVAITLDETGISGSPYSSEVSAGTATSYSIDTIGSPQTAGTPFEITITALDGNLNTATGYSGPATLSTTAGTITPGTANFTDGVATLDVDVTDAGTGQTITAIDGTLSTTSNTFDVDPGAASEILINAGDGQSAEVGTAVATPPSVIVRDAEGNAVANESVIFEVTGGGGIVNPATAVSTDENGIATVTNWTLGSVAGTDNNTLSATVLGTLLTLTFTASATAGPASQVSFDVQPAPTTVAGQTITPAVVVEIQDSFGNLVDDAANEVSLALTTPDGATLSGTLTQAAESGAATFSDLSVDQTGNYTLTATTSGLDPAESESFEITAGDADATESDIGADPASGLIANGSDSSTLTITVRDGGGNLLEGEDVFFEITGGTGGTLSAGPWTTDASGQATVTLTSVDANTITVTGYLGSDNSGATVGTAEVVFEAGPADNVLVTVVQGIAAADGTDDLEYQVTIEDANENPVSGVSVVASDDGADITYPSGTTLDTDVNGQVSFTATSSTVQSGVTFTFNEQDNNNNITALGSFE
jgi:adhesin/invasin